MSAGTLRSFRHDQAAGEGDLGSPLLRYLVSAGRLSVQAAQRADQARTESGERLERIVTRLGLLSEKDLTDAFSALMNLPIAAAGEFPATPLLTDRLTASFLKNAQILPLAEEADCVCVAMVNPLDSYACEAVRYALGKPLRIRVAALSVFDAAFERLYGGGTGALAENSRSAANARISVVSDDVDRLRDIASEAPVIRYVNNLIARAVEMRASDIHIEPLDSGLRVRYRIDGVLKTVETPPQRSAAAIVSRVKIMARLNIAERRLAQDGRISLAVRGTDIDFRVSTMPTVYGESVVLRILDRARLALDFPTLGLEAELIAPLREMLNRPFGIFLVTGPTGSGKTTTLYAALMELNTEDRKVLTVEDPVEYHLDGINQVQVKPQIGLTFANTLRSFLRQDPDVMMIGEIRDLETAQIAVQAALTGHVILSTLHTNDAPSAITRLLDMGVEDYLLTSTINGVAAQRLVRTLCEKCKEAYEPVTAFAARFGLTELCGGEAITLYRPTGCEACGHTGFCGRTAILELLPMTDRIRQAVLQSPEASALHALGLDAGMQTMQTHGLRKALKGVTTVEEVLRVTRGNA